MPSHGLHEGHDTVASLFALSEKTQFPFAVANRGPHSCILVGDAQVQGATVTPLTASPSAKAQVLHSLLIALFCHIVLLC